LVAKIRPQLCVQVFKIGFGNHVGLDPCEALYDVVSHCSSSLIAFWIGLAECCEIVAVPDRPPIDRFG
jgi:hypothetical protein